MLTHALVAALILRFVFPRAGVDRRHSLMQWWSMKLVRILGVEPLARGELPPAGIAGMIAANHVSWLDVFLVLAVRPTRFIAKSEIRDWPVAGWIAERAGTIFIHRGRRHDTGRISARVHDALSEGDFVGLFPEGTTTDGDRVLKFHSSLFEPAVANAAPVYPVAIRYRGADGSLCREMSFAGEITFMQSVAMVARQRGVTAILEFGPPLATAGAARRDLARIARERVATLLGLEEAGNAPGAAFDPRAVPL